MKLYLSDLDGTLLKGDKTISQHTLDNLKSLRERGLKFSIATARGFESAKRFLEILNLDIPVVLANGVYIYDTRSGEYLSTKSIEKGLAKEVVDLCISKGQYPFVSGQKLNGDFRVYYHDVHNEGQAHYYNDRVQDGDQRFRQISQYGFLDSFVTTTIVLIGKEDELIPLKDDLLKVEGLSINFLMDIYSKYYWIEINSKDATKGYGLEYLKEKLRVDQVVCFGDNHNDIPMFEVADAAVAMANAQDDIKAKADFLTLSNEEDGVIEYILKDFNE